MLLREIFRQRVEMIKEYSEYGYNRLFVGMKKPKFGELRKTKRNSEEEALTLAAYNGYYEKWREYTKIIRNTVFKAIIGLIILTVLVGITYVMTFDNQNFLRYLDHMKNTEQVLTWLNMPQYKQMMHTYTQLFPTIARIVGVLTLALAVISLVWLYFKKQEEKWYHRMMQNSWGRDNGFSNGTSTSIKKYSDLDLEFRVQDRINEMLKD